jgi:ABC-type polysaccharide/polyol phosphate transport system ATPase subunit
MNDVKINLKNAHVVIPIFNSVNSSLKNKLLNVFKKNYDNTTYVSALKNINLSINQGEKVGLVGTNGSGKSTLLRLICQIYKPSAGSADINGKINSLIDISTGLDGEASGWNNIILRLTLYGLTKIQIEKKINEIVDFSELGKVIHNPFYSYSSGMKLRLAFATLTATVTKIF